VEETNTPGVAGYVLAYVISDVIYVGALCLPGVFAPSDVGDYALPLVDFYLFAVVWVGFWGLPIGAVLIPLVHWFCSDTESQVRHVLTAGLAGVVGIWIATTYMFPLEFGDAGWYYLAGSASTALARAAVIPLVVRRRRPGGEVPLLHREQRPLI